MKNLFLILALTFTIGCSKEEAPKQECCYKILSLVNSEHCISLGYNGLVSFEVENICNGGLDTSVCITPYSYPELFDSLYFGGNQNYMIGTFLCEI